MRSIKYLMVLCLLLFAGFIVDQDPASAATVSKIASKQVNAEKYVNVDGSLILRDAPNSKGKKVSMLKDGSKVFVYSTDENGWSYVKQGQLRGYVKDSYLISSVKKDTAKSNGKAVKKRVVDFSMNVNQVKKMEPATLNRELKDGNVTMLIYNVKKFGYNAELQYMFEGGRLEFIVFDFLPGKDSYHTSYEMEILHDLLHKQAVKELGNDFTFINTQRNNNIYTRWEKKSYDITLMVTDTNLYTNATLMYHRKL